MRSDFANLCWHLSGLAALPVNCKPFRAAGRTILTDRALFMLTSTGTEGRKSQIFCKDESYHRGQSLLSNTAVTDLISAAIPVFRPICENSRNQHWLVFCSTAFHFMAPVSANKLEPVVVGTGATNCERQPVVIFLNPVAIELNRRIAKSLSENQRLAFLTLV